MSNFCQLWLTCGSKNEASKIAQALLEKNLIACARQIPVSSDFRWQGRIDHSDEILLMMESSMALFDRVEQEITKFHHYETFVLEATPVERLSKKSRKLVKPGVKKCLTMNRPDPPTPLSPPFERDWL